MTENTTPIPFGQAVPKPPLEPDRHELTAGLRIVITDILISTQTRFDKVAKINGLVSGSPMKYYTTSKTVVRDCEDILQNVGIQDNKLKSPVDCKVAAIKSKGGFTYLKLIDPSEA